ncbi:MAG: hypothetical protein JJ850_13480 [Kordiimonadaceae bacterium]|nr:hypothetical protein [Kordiimonadaceae bacterium]MBO6570276.1 hypothetical protein [Kordiimonadaceae bacterium]MBO6965626.1 hypothetical protein [Kordiimonadaceae bacterium]
MTDHIAIHIEPSGLSDGQLSALTADFRSALVRNGLDATFHEVKAAEGHKGVEVELGTLLLAAFTSGAVTAMIEVVKAYVARNKSFSVEVEGKGGQSVKISAENIESAELKELLADITNAAQG